MTRELIHAGFGNFLLVDRVVAVLPTSSAPTKRLIRESKNAGTLIDMTSGRKTKSVLIMDSGHIVLAAIAPETIAGRISANREG